MTARQNLDLVVKRIAGQDIRLAGNWDKLPVAAEYLREIADHLGIAERDFLRCTAIADIIDLLERQNNADQRDSGHPSLF